MLKTVLFVCGIATVMAFTALFVTFVVITIKEMIEDR